MHENQMEMFNEDITLKDEGGEVEEKSGNEVPLGGIKEGVTDDQDAHLSPGEMVISQDVVSWHGAKFFMTLRDEAKMGYHKMEAMGQLGNADEATIPTEAIFNPGGLPFSVVDLEYIDMDEDADVAEAMSGMDEDADVAEAMSGMDEDVAEAIPDVMEAQAGTLVPVQQPSATFIRTNPETGLPETTAAPASSIPQVLQPATPVPITTGSALTPTTLTGLTPPSTPISRPDQPPAQQTFTPPPLPPIQQFLGGVQGTNFFINEIGQVIQIPVINGRQIYETPEGFQSYDPTNPQPFDPDKEPGLTVPDEQPQQPRRTVTERDLEGGGPSVGAFGADLPGLEDPTGRTGIGLGSLDALSDGIDSFDQDGNVDRANSISGRNLTVEQWGKFSTQKELVGIFTGLGKLGGKRDDVAKPPPGYKARTKPPAPVEYDVREVEDVVLGGTGRDTLDVSPFSGPTTESPSAPVDWGGWDGPSTDAPDTGGYDDPGEAQAESQAASGGLISPRLHRKRMKKNNRKGLAARK